MAAVRAGGSGESEEALKTRCVETSSSCCESRNMRKIPGDHQPVRKIPAIVSPDSEIVAAEPRREQCVA